MIRSYFSDIFKKPTIKEQYQVLEIALNAAGINTSKITKTSSIKLMLMALLKSNDYLYKLLNVFGTNLTSIFAANGIFLDVIGQGFFDELRTDITPTTGIIIVNTLSTVDEVILKNEVTGVSYRASHNGDIDDEISLTFTSTEGGSHTVCSIYELVSTNPTAYTISASNVSSTSWIETFGKDPEPDDQYRERCLAVIRNKSNWSSKSKLYSAIYDKFGGQAARFAMRKPGLNSAEQILYIAATNGYINDGITNRVQDWVNLYSPSENVIICYPALPVNVSFSGNLICKKGTTKQQQENVRTELAKWFNSLPIYDPFDTRTHIHLYDVYNAVKNIVDYEGVVIYPSFYMFKTGTSPASAATSINSVIPHNDYCIYTANVSSLSISNSVV
jgi:hypothetical protein